MAAISSATTGLENSNNIYPNQVLSIPVNCSCGDPSVSLDYGLFTTYVVQSGDQLASLATNFSVSSDYISKYNSNVQVLQPNQIIYIPTRSMTFEILSSNHVCCKLYKFLFIYLFIINIFSHGVLNNFLATLKERLCDSLGRGLQTTNLVHKI